MWALAAATEAEAVYQSQPRARTRLMRDRGIFLQIEPPDVVAGYTYPDAERARMDQMRANSLVGTPRQVGDRIRALVDELSLDEIAIVTWAYEESVRLESYRLIAKELGVEPRVGA